MSSTDSDGLEKVVGIPPELVVGLVQNEWTASIRIDGRHEPEHAPGTTTPSNGANVQVAVHWNQQVWRMYLRWQKYWTSYPAQAWPLSLYGFSSCEKRNLL
jgi:hypothetical protein